MQLPNFHLQLEAINLQHNDTLKGNYREKNLTELHKCLPSNEYAQLKPYTHGLISGFGSTYEKKISKTFSKIKYIKSYEKSALTNEHLLLILMIGNANFELQ